MVVALHHPQRVLLHVLARHEPGRVLAAAALRALFLHAADAQALALAQRVERQALVLAQLAAALAVLNVAEGLYLDWALKAPKPMPDNFVHAEWITLHDNPAFQDFVAFLQAELDRVGPQDAVLAGDFYQRTVALEPRGKGILLTTLRSHDEVRDESEFFDSIASKRVDKKMLDIAETIVEQQSGEFDPSAFKDRYEEALRELIRRKQKCQKPVTAAPPDEDEKVIDLMEALRRSVAKKGGGSHAERVMSQHKKTAKKKRAGAKR